MLRTGDPSSSVLAPITGNIEPASKKARQGPTNAISNLLHTRESDLDDLPHETLVSHVLALQGAYKEISAQLASALKKQEDATSRPEANGAAAPQSMTPEQVATKANQMATIMGREIRKQMKWQYVH